MIALIDGIVDGVGTSASVRGTAGIGKTFLLDAVSRAAAERNVVVHRVTADQISALAPLAAIGALLDVGVDAKPEPIASDHTGSPSLIASFGAPSADVVDRLVAAFETEPSTPRVLIIDDAEWLDRWSLVALRRLLRLAPQFSNLVIVAWRLDALATRHTNNLLDVRFDHDFELGPFDSGAALRAARDFVGDRAIGPVLRRIIRRADGNPLHIAEVMRHALPTLSELSGGVDTPTDAIPTSLTRSINYRLGQLSTELGDVMTMFSLLGDRASFVDIEAATQLTPDVLLVRLRELEGMGFLRLHRDEAVFSHSLYRQTEYERMPVAVRRAAHARLAEMTAPSLGPASLRHRALALDRTDETTAAELEAAAKSARGNHPDQAIDLMHLALELSDPDKVEPRIEQLAAMLIEAGRCGDALDILLPEDGSRPSSPEAEILASCALSLQSRHAEAAERLRRLLETEPATKVKALASASRALAVLATGSAGAETVATTAVSHAVAAADSSLESLSRSCRGRALAYSHDYLGSLAETLHAVELADRSDHGLRHRFAPHFFHAISLLDLDRHAEVEAACAAGRVRANDAGTQYTLSLFDTALAALAYRRDDGDGAHTFAMVATSEAEDLEALQTVVWSLSIAALTELDRGATAAAAELLDRAEDHLSSGSPLLGVDFYHLAHVRLLEQQGSVDEARLAIDTAWDLFSELGIRNCLPLLGPSRIRLDQGSSQSRAVAEVVEVASDDWLGASAPGVVAIGRWCLALDAGDADALAAVSQEFALLGRNRDALEVSLDRASLLARNGDSSGARSVLFELGDSVSRHGGQLVRLERDMREAGGGVAEHLSILDRSDTLTLGEQRLVDLVVAGQTNTEIAADVGVSIRTVEAQLHRVFGKLGINNRAQLVRLSPIKH